MGVSENVSEFEAQICFVGFARNIRLSHSNSLTSAEIPEVEAR